MRKVADGKQNILILLLLLIFAAGHLSGQYTLRESESGFAGLQLGTEQREAEGNHESGAVLAAPVRGSLPVFIRELNGVHANAAALRTDPDSDGLNCRLSFCSSFFLTLLLTFAGNLIPGAVSTLLRPDHSIRSRVIVISFVHYSDGQKSLFQTA